MKLKLAEIDPNSISLHRELYRISLRPPDSCLIDRIKCNGIRNPVIVTGSNSCVLISGFRRYLAAQLLQIRSIPAWIVPVSNTDIDAQQIWEIIWNNIPDNKYDPIELAYGLVKTSQILKIDPVQFYRRFHPLFDSFRLNDLIEIGSLPRPFLARLFKRGADFNRFKILTGFNAANRRRIAVLTTICGHMSLSQLRLFAGYIKDISSSDSSTIARILKSAELKAVYQDKDRLPADKSRWLWDNTHTMRYPQLTGFSSKFIRKIRNMHPPANIRIAEPPLYEGRALELLVNLEKTDDISALIQWLSQHTNDIEHLLEMLAGKEADGSFSSDTDR